MLGKSKNQKEEVAQDATSLENANNAENIENFETEKKEAVDEETGEVVKVEESSEIAKVEENSQIVKDEPVIFNWDDMEAVDNSQLKELSAEYFTPVEGVTYNFICTGTEQVDNFDGTEGTQTVVSLYDRNQNRFIAGQKMLVSCVEKYLEANPNKKQFGIRVICEGKAKGKEGNYFVLKVLVF